MRIDLREIAVAKKQDGWCPGRESNPYSQRPRDFKSLVSTNFTTRAGAAICFAPRYEKGKATGAFPFRIWSGRRVSNSRPQPWQGCALPTELLPRISWRRGPESNRPTRICNPVHNRFATAPPTNKLCVTTYYRKKLCFSQETWSGRRVSNSRPQPWQGCALPTELLPRQTERAL